MKKYTCVYCKGSAKGCTWCKETGQLEFSFDTIEEVREWQKQHPRGIYGENTVWLGQCREELEMYLESHEKRIPMDELYDIKYGILRYEI